MEQKNRILIVEDDTDINNLLYTALQKAGYETVQAFSGTEARMLFQMDKAGFSLILLDLMLPGISGEEVLAQIRKQGNTPVIVLTAKDGLDEKIGLLTSGADDYITKPFSKTVLVSKIRAMVRRTNQYVSSSDEVITEVKKGPFALRMDSQTVLKNGKEISLTSKEFSLLYLFIENPEYIFSKQELFSKVWRSDNCDDSTILVYIKKLRDKLEDDPSHPTHICTVWGKGYKFCI